MCVSDINNTMHKFHTKSDCISYLFLTCLREGFYFLKFHATSTCKLHMLNEGKNKEYESAQIICSRKMLGYLFDDSKAHEGHLRGQEESIEC